MAAKSKKSKKSEKSADEDKSTLAARRARIRTGVRAGKGGAAIGAIALLNASPVALERASGLSAFNRASLVDVAA